MYVHVRQHFFKLQSWAKSEWKQQNFVWSKGLKGSIVLPSPWQKPSSSYLFPSQAKPRQNGRARVGKLSYSLTSPILKNLASKFSLMWMNAKQILRPGKISHACIYSFTLCQTLMMGKCMLSTSISWMLMLLLLFAFMKQQHHHLPSPPHHHTYHVKHQPLTKFTPDSGSQICCFYSFIASKHYYWNMIQASGENAVINRLTSLFKYVRIHIPFCAAGFIFTNSYHYTFVQGSLLFCDLIRILMLKTLYRGSES